MSAKISFMLEWGALKYNCTRGLKQRILDPQSLSFVALTTAQVLNAAVLRKHISSSAGGWNKNNNLSRLSRHFLPHFSSTWTRPYKTFFSLIQAMLKFWSIGEAKVSHVTFQVSPIGWNLSLELISTEKNFQDRVHDYNCSWITQWTRLPFVTNRGRAIVKDIVSSGSNPTQNYVTWTKMTSLKRICLSLNRPIGLK